MSIWKYNKASFIVGGVGLVVFLGIAGLGISSYMQESETEAKIKNAERSIGTMSNKKITPTKKSLDESTALIEQYQQKMGDVEKNYDAFKANSKLEPISAQDFQNALKAESAAWKETCKSKKITVTQEAEWMGFGSYRTSAPYAQAAPMLNYQKAGIENFLNILTENGAVSFTRVYRDVLPNEQPKPASAEPATRRGRAAAQSESEPMWQYMPFEVTYTGTKKSIASVLNALTSSDKYLYTLSGLRIRNASKNAPVIKQPKVADEKKASGGGLSLDITASTTPDADKAEEPAPVEEILTPILGDEKVEVHMVVNLVYFPTVKGEEDAGEDAGADAEAEGDAKE